MFRHVLRNSTRTLPLIFTLNSSEAILTLAGLGFLGFGIEPTAAAEWGYDLNKALVGRHQRDLVDLASSRVSRSCSSCSASPWSARASTTWPTRACAAGGPSPGGGQVAETSVVPGGTLTAGPGGVDGLEGGRIVRRARNRGRP